MKVTFNLTNLLIFLVITAILISICLMKGYECGRNQGIDNTLIVHRPARFPKVSPIDSLGIFEKFRIKLRIPKIRYVDVIKEVGVEVLKTDTLSKVYGMHYGALAWQKRGKYITVNWFSCLYDSSQDTVITTIGTDTLIELANEKSNYDAVPTGDPAKPIEIHEYIFSTWFQKELGAALGGNHEEAGIRGNIRSIFKDRYYVELDTRFMYLYRESKLNPGIYGWIGMKF